MTVAEYFVRRSQLGRHFDPQASYDDIQRVTGLATPDVRIGVLDLVGAGLLEKQDYHGGHTNIWPKNDLFVAFDAAFMEWNPEQDAHDLAVYLLNHETDQLDVTEVASALGWQPRRFNAASAYLVTARAVKPGEALSGSDYWPHRFYLGDELLRFVRNI